jgi:hypothetical protein
MLSCPSNGLSCLAMWSSGNNSTDTTAYYGDSKFIDVLFLVGYSTFPLDQHKFEARPLVSLLTEFRIYEVCIAQNYYPFLSQLLTAKRKIVEMNDQRKSFLILKKRKKMKNKAQAKFLRKIREMVAEKAIQRQFQWHQHRMLREYQETTVKEECFEVAATNKARSLNHSQLIAFNEFINSSASHLYPGITLVHGPPGTGKSHFLVALLLRYMADNVHIECAVVNSQAQPLQAPLQTM